MQQARLQEICAHPHDLIEQRLPRYVESVPVTVRATLLLLILHYPDDETSELVQLIAETREFVLQQRMGHLQNTCAHTHIL